MDDKTELENLSRDILLLSDFVHGNESTSVLLGGVDTPTLRALVSDIKTGVHSMVSRLETYETRLARLEVLLEGFGEIVTDETASGGSATYEFRPIGALIVTGDVPKTTTP